MAQPRLKSKALATLFFFLMMCVSVLSNNNNNKDGLPDYEAEYLLKLREDLHNVPSDWLDNKTGMCSWTGVQCTTPDITNSRNVQGIDLGYKKLTGTIPSGLNDSLMSLTLVNLGGNSLSGPLPSLASLYSLQSAYLFQNNFTSIPHGCFQGLDNLENLDLRDNTNLPPWTFPTELNKYSHLITLDLSATNLMGFLPDTFHSFPVLGRLYLSENNLTGVLPESFRKLRRLQGLDLSYQKGNNKLSGTIHFLSSLPELFDVDLQGNSFEGSIPDLSNHSHPLALLLANNRLTGVLPPSLFLGNQQIVRATLDNNWLQGPLPIFNNSTTEVTFGGNGFCLNHSGPCDYRVTTLLQVAEAVGYPFRLAQSWRGNNPCQGWDFITCHNNGNIRAVNLTNLNLTGEISPAFKNLTDLYELYLGGNKLSGSIPESLTTLQHLKIVDVSNNNLSGNIPTFSTKVKFITAGNALIKPSQAQRNGTPSPSTVIDNRPSAPASRTSLSPPWIIGISIVGVGVIVILLVTIYDHRRCFNLLQRMIRKKEAFVEQKVEELLQSYGTSTPIRYTYAEVKQMTNSFHEKLGQGGYGIVYKASLIDGRQVAVKVLKETKGSVEEFVNEVVTISRTSHVNIVSLLGFCYEMNKRALIYEFMPNGSLDKFIFKEGSSHLISNLDWSTLYRITISVARGLDYLHRGCNTRILHLDIKPQNILLDGNFCPKIADFGLAKICKMDESIVSILGTRGTPGYIAPEMFSRIYGGVSHKSDVYSYGMLVVEMIGGKKNYDTGESHSNDMYFPDWIYKDLEEGNIHSRNLAHEGEENDITRKITLVSLWCIQINPSNRPSMSRVVEMLEGPLQSIPYPPKPVVSSPTRPSLQFSDASYSSEGFNNSRSEFLASSKTEG